MRNLLINIQTAQHTFSHAHIHDGYQQEAGSSCLSEQTVETRFYVRYTMLRIIAEINFAIGHLFEFFGDTEMDYGDEGETSALVYAKQIYTRRN